MSLKLKRVLLLVSAALMLLGSSRVQRSMNGDRERLGLTRVQPLENAPPVLAFTTIALGGFRGLISNALWIRATELQDDDKYFEMAQLADWITKLEPHFVQVWLVQAWNMAYNISVKFKETEPGQYPDRWRWVKRGIELLRDDGLRYNPNEVLMYRELGWFFQHKMGANLDDAHMYYKWEWIKEMSVVFGGKTPNLDELVNPQTADQKRRAALLANQYKMDAAFMKQLDQRYGPLEWRLPEAHAIYWAAKGLEAARENPTKVKQDDLITLHRLIYQSMQLSFQRGVLVTNMLAGGLEFGPNLDIIPKVSAAYEAAAEEDANNRDHILHAHRNFLRDAVYFLYANNRLGDAAYWFKYLGAHYPNLSILDGHPNALPSTLTLDEYAVARVQEDVTDTNDQNRMKAIIQGLLVNSYASLAGGQDERATGFALLAEKMLTTYQSKTQTRPWALEMGSLEDTKRLVLGRLLDSEHGAPLEMRAALRSRLGMEPEVAPAPAATNAPSQPPVP
jgi:hypothetical protein